MKGSPEVDRLIEYSSVHLARISLESQIKEEEIEESREDYDSHGRPRDRGSRLTRRENLSSFIGGNQGQSNLMDPRSSRPPSHSSFGSPGSRAVPTPQDQSTNQNSNN